MTQLCEHTKKRMGPPPLPSKEVSLIKSMKPYRTISAHMQPLMDFLNVTYPMKRSIILVDFSTAYASWVYQGERVTGFIEVKGASNALVRVASKGRSLRAIALTTAHEYMHCIQFIQRDLCMHPSNKMALEKEAVTFAEDTLKALWETQKIFYPSIL